jgi:hypothetical protein
MVHIDMRRNNNYTHEIPTTRPSGCSLQRQRVGLLSGYHPTAQLSVTPTDTQTFPILPGQLEQLLERAQQCLTQDLPTQAFPASGSTPSPSPSKSLVFYPPPETLPTVYAFQASALGMPSFANYTQLLARYLDEMTPSRRGKALIDSDLLGRIKLVLTFQHKGLQDSGEMGSGSDSPCRTAFDAGEIWATQPFRRWVRSTFVYRQATPAELERAIDFGLLSPPESSLSGPGIAGHPPSTGLTCSASLVFHQDRPVALRSRIYKIILRAHWITNHAGRDRTWATVQGVCSYIPKRLVHDFVAACPACRVARSGQYGTSHAEIDRPGGVHGGATGALGGGPPWIEG